MKRRVERHDETIELMAGSIAVSAEREEALMEALDLDEHSRKGDKGSIDTLRESILRLEEYLLRNAERIDKILATLKSHREILAKMNAAYFKAGERDRLKVELDVMRNTLSVLALAGTELDTTLLKDIKSIQEGMKAGKLDLVELRRSKNQLDKKFDEELKRFDLEALYLKRRNIPGYV